MEKGLTDPYIQILGIHSNTLRPSIVLAKIFKDEIKTLISYTYHLNKDRTP